MGKKITVDNAGKNNTKKLLILVLGVIFDSAIFKFSQKNY